MKNQRRWCVKSPHWETLALRFPLNTLQWLQARTMTRFPDFTTNIAVIYVYLLVNWEAHKFQTTTKGVMLLFSQYFYIIIFLNQCGRVCNFFHDVASHRGHDVIAGLHFQAPAMNQVEQQR